VPSSRLLAFAVATAVLGAGVSAAAAEQSAALRPMTTLDAMTALAARGLGELHAITPTGDRYRVVVRDGAGRLRDMDMDAATGTLVPADTGGIFSNSIDPELFVRLRGSLAPALPPGARPAHELVSELMRSGRYKELHEIRFVEDAYRARLRDHDGQLAEVWLDPVSGKVVQ
jgi:hypothetical protein